MSEDDPRTRLRESALSLFGRHGVANTSTRDILAAAKMKNPSAITYHFGSKAELVDDLVREILNRRDSVLQPQIDLAAREPHPTVEEWTAIAVDWSLGVVSTERGCLLARLYWEYDGHLKPVALEEFLASDRPMAREWKDAIVQTFPSLPPWIALARNATVLRTLEWMMARKAAHNLGSGLSYWHDHQVESRPFLVDVCVGILTAPNSLPPERWPPDARP
jgi:AcrR family transcriptional regulator